MRAAVLADALDAVADECRRMDVVNPFSSDADALHAAALRAGTETLRLARRIEAARGWRWRLRRLTGRDPGPRR
jgi:hypothetical protein